MREGSRLLRRPCLHSRAASAPHATPISLPGRQRLPRRLRASPLSARIQHPPALRPHVLNPALPLRALIAIFLESFETKNHCHPEAGEFQPGRRTSTDPRYKPCSPPPTPAPIPPI